MKRDKLNMYIELLKRWKLKRVHKVDDKFADKIELHSFTGILHFIEYLVFF